MFSLGYDLDDDKSFNSDMYKEIEGLTIDCIKKDLQLIKKLEATVVIVTNEIGLGIVPENKLSRLYSDITGKANQILADLSDEVVMVVSGLPLKIKERHAYEASL